MSQKGEMKGEVGKETPLKEMDLLTSRGSFFLETLYSLLRGSKLYDLQLEIKVIVSDIYNTN